MNFAAKLTIALNENLPNDLKMGKKYKTITVDGETFKNMEVVTLNPSRAEIVFKSPEGKHTFNYVEQEIKFK